LQHLHFRKALVLSWELCIGFWGKSQFVKNDEKLFLKNVGAKLGFLVSFITYPSGKPGIGAFQRKERPMGISKYNSEGYYDPTVHEAVRNMEMEQRKWRPLVYICSPYSGNVEENTQKARGYCRYAVERGAIPIAAHLLFPQFISEATERELAMFMDMVLMGKCEEVWVFGTAISAGMAAEITKAKRRNMRIRYFTEKCEENL
jgi:hypothetical protein